MEGVLLRSGVAPAVPRLAFGPTDDTACLVVFARLIFYQESTLICIIPKSANLLNMINMYTVVVDELGTI